VCRADASDGLDSYDDDAESAVFVNQLAQQITTAAADMKVGGLTARRLMNMNERWFRGVGE
jgi:hypothetical protein